MFARVSTFEGAPEQVDEMTRYADEQVLPALRGMDGFAGAFGLADRGSGKVVAVILWETEEAMRASEEAANRLRGETAETVGEQVAGVERYEVTFAEVRGTQLKSASAYVPGAAEARRWFATCCEIGRFEKRCGASGS